jgi:long-subunit acyl-CoA synthetase (AMP-forming)
VHRLSGIVTPASAAYSASELRHQIETSGAKALVTCAPLLGAALEAANAAGIPEDRIFILEVGGIKHDTKLPFATIDDLIAEGKKLPELEPLNWTKGQGARQPAYLCYSSGTSGHPVSRRYLLRLSAPGRCRPSRVASFIFGIRTVAQRANI